MCLACGNGDRYLDEHHPPGTIYNDPGMLEELKDRLTFCIQHEEISKSPGWHLWHRHGGVTVRFRTDEDGAVVESQSYPSDPRIVALADTMTELAIKEGWGPWCERRPQ